MWLYSFWSNGFRQPDCFALNFQRRCNQLIFKKSEHAHHFSKKQWLNSPFFLSQLNFLLAHKKPTAHIICMREQFRASGEYVLFDCDEKNDENLFGFPKTTRHTVLLLFRIWLVHQLKMLLWWNISHATIVISQYKCMHIGTVHGIRENTAQANLIFDELSFCILQWNRRTHINYAQYAYVA